MRLSSLITAVDVHAGGEPGRVITGGVRDIPGQTMFEKRLYLEQHLDWLRKRMLREPRGYPGLCCNILLPPTDPAADAGFVIMEQTEYPPMSGSNTICVVTVLLETGILPAQEPLTELVLEAPAGLLRVRAEVTQGKVHSVEFENVPAFAVHLGAPLEVPGFGTLNVDVAYGGMFYVIAPADAVGLRLTPDEGRDIARLGELLRAAARDQLPATHPDNPAIDGVSIAQFSGPATRPGVAMRNAVAISTGHGGVLDRSACGTGTCARMAALYARGQLRVGEDFCHEGILGTVFTGRVLRETRVGSYPAVVPSLKGQAWITGFSHYVLDPNDPFPEGFTVGDLW